MHTEIIFQLYTKGSLRVYTTTRAPIGFKPTNNRHLHFNSVLIGFKVKDLYYILLGDEQDCLYICVYRSILYWDLLGFKLKKFYVLGGFWKLVVVQIGRGEGEEGGCTELSEG